MLYQGSLWNHWDRITGGGWELVAAIYSLRRNNFAVVSDSLFGVDGSVLEAECEAYGALPADDKGGHRFRAHSSFIVNRDGTVTAGKAGFNQPVEYNIDAGGDVRYYAAVPDTILQSPAILTVIAVDAAIAKIIAPEVFRDREATLDIHAVRYAPPYAGEASISMPYAPHRDPEPFVAVHLMGRSANLRGGSNTLAPGHEESPDNLVPALSLDLLRCLDTILLGPKMVHQVESMTSADLQPAHRDVLLVTFK